ncbi:MAG: DUF2092 domain-containing protein [Telluria sp.]
MEILRYLAAVAAAATVGGAGAQQQAAPPPATQQQAAQQAAPQLTASQAQARDLLLRMGRYLSGLPAFSVTVRSNYDALQPSGQKIEFGELRKLVVQRPNHLRADTERSDGTRTTALFTGSELVLLDVSNKIYASAPQPGGLDESILYFVSDLHMRFPLAMLLMNRLPVELERRVRSVDYVETSYLLGPPTHHLAARGDTVDFQVWVRDGAQPLPLRVVITYKEEPGQPEFRADFTDWNVRPAIAATTFKAQVPSGAQKIAFAAQLTALGTPGHNPK